jgi:hypothetical protein
MAGNVSLQASLLQCTAHDKKPGTMGRAFSDQIER